MRARIHCFSMALILAIAMPAFTQDAPEHAAFRVGQIEWGPAPPVLERGAQVAVIKGNPAEEGIFAIRIKMPRGYRIAPHWHPAYEHVTVISGRFGLGHGDTFNTERGELYGPGDFLWMAPRSHHFAWAAQDDTVIQVHGMGPWQLYYVNAADDPRERAPAQ